MSKSSLVIVGSGIKFLSHLTTEAKTYIEQSDKVLYLVNNPAMKEWILKVNSSAESLDCFYKKYTLRIDSYQAITKYILETLRKPQHVCVVFYGHPCVYANPGLEAAQQAKQEGLYTKILPGISAEDCLFSDLMIDPGSCGCQSFEATDFLIHRKKIDVSCHIVLWQIDVIGIKNNPEKHNNENGAKLLINYLNEYYDLEHKVILYEAAQYPGFEPRIEQLSLKNLPKAKFTHISMLYIPPACKSKLDKEILKILNIND